MARLMVYAAVLTGLVAAGYYYWVRPVVVTTIALEVGPVAVAVYASGVVEPEQWAKVTSLERQRITGILVEERDRVERGQPVIELDASEARASLRDAQARRDLAAKQVWRLADLAARNISREADLDAARTELERAEATLVAARAHVQRYTIAAPLDGMVLRLDGEIGEIAEAGEPLAWIGELADLQVVAEINEEDIPSIRPGQTAWLRADAFPQAPLEATVARITPMGDPLLKTYRTYLALPADSPLMVGMTLDVNIVVEEIATASLLPIEAVRDGRVMVVRDGQAVPVTIETGVRTPSRIQILAGLPADARAIVPWPETIDPGARVRAAEPSPP